MKFNDKNSAVHLLTKNGSEVIEIPKDSNDPWTAFVFLYREFPGLRPAFRESIQYLCRPFFDAYEKGKEKLLEALQKEPVHKSGTFIYTMANGETRTAFYDLDARYNGSKIVVNGRTA